MFPYIISKFRGGISDENDKGILGSFKFGYGLDIRSRADVLTCNQALVKESAAIVVDLIRFIVPCSDGNAYGFGDTGNIYKRKGTTWTLEYTDANGAIKGAAEWNGYIYWACDTEISRILVTQADDGTWDADVAHDWNTTLTAADWHTMKIAMGELMLANAQYLAMIDFAAAAFTAQAYKLRPENLAKCLEEDGDYLLVGSTHKGNAEKGHLWSFGTTAINWLQKKKLATKGVNAIISAENMLCQCGIDGEVYYSDMVSRVPLFAFPDGGYCLPGGVTNKRGLSLFGVAYNSSSKCGVYEYGRPIKNFSRALNLSYVPSPAIITGIEIGAVEVVDGTLLVAWKNTTGPVYGVDALSTTAKASAVYEGLEFDAGRPYHRKYFKHLKIEMKPLPASCSIVVKYKLNNALSWTTAKTPAGASSSSVTGATTAIFIIDGEGEVFEVRVELTPSANTTPAINTITTYFDFQEKGLYD